MADAENNVEAPEGETQETQATKQDAESNPTSELEAKIAKLTKDLENARKGERFAKSTKEELAKRVEELEAQGDWKARAEAAELKLKDYVLDSQIEKAALAAKAKDVKAVTKLIDRSVIKFENGSVDTKSVENAIAAAKKEFAILFDEVQVPQAGRAAEGEVTSGYEKEIRAAKSFPEIKAVMRKYNKG